MSENTTQQTRTSQSATSTDTASAEQDILDLAREKVLERGEGLSQPKLFGR